MIIDKIMSHAWSDCVFDVDFNGVNNSLALLLPRWRHLVGCLERTSTQTVILVLIEIFQRKYYKSRIENEELDKAKDGDESKAKVGEAIGFPRDKDPQRIRHPQTIPNRAPERPQVDIVRVDLLEGTVHVSGIFGRHQVNSWRKKKLRKNYQVPDVRYLTDDARKLAGNEGGEWDQHKVTETATEQGHRQARVHRARDEHKRHQAIGERVIVAEDGAHRVHILTKVDQNPSQNVTPGRSPTIDNQNLSDALETLKDEQAGDNLSRTEQKADSHVQRY